MGLTLIKNQILWFFFFSNLDLGFNTVSIVKTTSKKLGALMRSLKLLSPEIVPYSCKLTIRNICSDAANWGVAWAFNGYLGCLFYICYFSWTLDQTSKCVHFHRGVVVIITAELHSKRMNSGSAQFQTLLSECWSFVMMRIPDNGPG